VPWERSKQPNHHRNTPLTFCYGVDNIVNKDKRATQKVKKVGKVSAAEMVLGRVIDYHIQPKPQKRKVVVDNEDPSYEPESEQESDGDEEVRGLTALNAGRRLLFADNFDQA
jgi:hypothetical protein